MLYFTFIEMCPGNIIKICTDSGSFWSYTDAADFIRVVMGVGVIGQASKNVMIGYLYLPVFSDCS
jgi:hypothetical protein